MASALYRLLGKRVGRGFEIAKAQNLFRKFVCSSGDIEIMEKEIVVTLGRRANNPLLLVAGYGDRTEPVPWLDNRMLRIRFF